MNNKIYTIACLLIVLAIGCSEPEPELSKADKKLVDSIYATKLNALNEKWDSICQIYQDSLIELKTDSIIKVRKKQINVLAN